MISKTVRQALQGTAVAAVVAFLAAPAAMAAHGAPPPPAAPPVCMAGVGMAAVKLTDFIPPSFFGRNLVNIPRVSAIVGTPDDLTNNGFHAVCRGMGLTATGNAATMADIDGDSLPDNADLFQYDGHNGTVATYKCHQIVSGGPFDEGGGIEIQPSLSSSGLVIPPTTPTNVFTISFVAGLECTQAYAAYEAGAGKGTQLLPITPVQACPDRVCVCEALDLAKDTVSIPAKRARIKTVWADHGQVEEFDCGALVDPFVRGGGAAVLAAGEAAWIINPGNTGAVAGAPTNCAPGGGLGLAGIPCPGGPAYTPMAATYPGLPLFPPGPTFPVPPFPLIYP